MPEIKILYKKLEFIRSLFLVVILVITSLAARGQLVISEFAASNSTILADQFGEYSDWIEIHNNSSFSQNLSGWSLTDNSSNLFKWSFPPAEIAAGGYLVVFASGRDIRQTTSYLHTNFKLSKSGEYLMLVNPSGEKISGFAAGYPVQYSDVSYALIDGNFVYTSSPTPNGPNINSPFLLPPEFSVSRGLFYEPFELDLTNGNAEVGAIKYTTDGSNPTITNGTVFTTPIPIDSTSIIRAICIFEDKMSHSTTNTYIFPEQVLVQPDFPTGYPSTWGNGVAADYGMDEEIYTEMESRDQILESFHQLPVVSVVSETSNFFSAQYDSETGGIYVFTDERWERPASFEHFGEAEINEIQINCGVRLQGGQSRVPNNSPKHSFRLVFKSEFGPKKLEGNLFKQEAAAETFNTLHLKATYNNSWIHWDSDQRKSSQYMRDNWMKQLYRQMSQSGVYTKNVNLFINGLYWGLYTISERVDKEFMESYFGGDAENYDVIKDYVELVDGSLEAWNTLIAKSREGLSDNSDYFQLQGKNSDGSENLAWPVYIEPENLADYMLLNFYGGNLDWDHHNWIAARNRENPRKGFQFFVWDAERVLEDVNEDILTVKNAGCPSEVFQAMIKNNEFKILFADRVQKHLFNNGCLTPEAVMQSWETLSGEIKPAVYAESARWGDYRRDVNPRNSPFPLYTTNFWFDEKDRLLYDYFPFRSDILIGQLKTEGWLPDIPAPTFNQYGGEVSSAFELEMDSPEGTIFYSLTDDPRMVGGEISPNAVSYNSPVPLTGDSVRVKARTKSGDNWSPLTEAIFSTGSLNPITTIPENNYRISNYPNPVNDNTTILCSFPKGGSAQLLIMSIHGKIIQAVDLGYQPQGKFKYIFDASRLSGGVYLYKIRCGEMELKSKMIVTR